MFRPSTPRISRTTSRAGESPRATPARARIARGIRPSRAARLRAVGLADFESMGTGPRRGSGRGTGGQIRAIRPKFRREPSPREADEGQEAGSRRGGPGPIIPASATLPPSISHVQGRIGEASTAKGPGVGEAPRPSTGFPVEPYRPGRAILILLRRDHRHDRILVDPIGPVSVVAGQATGIPRRRRAHRPLQRSGRDSHKFTTTSLPR